MFTVDATIDAIQTGKKTFVNTFVTNEKAATAMNKFVDAQTEYTKKAVKAGTDAFTTLASEAVNTVKGFDYAKVTEQFTKATEQYTKAFSK